jgi:hypothetical protein
MGSAEVAAFDAARRVAINEIAKVVSNPNLTGQLSDAARREVESFIPEQATLKQINAVADILKTDMQNRHQSLDVQLKEIRTRLGSTSGGGGGSVKVRRKADGKTGSMSKASFEANKDKYDLVQ